MKNIKSSLIKKGLAGLLALAPSLPSCDTCSIIPPQTGQLAVYDHCKDEMISNEWLANYRAPSEVVSVQLDEDREVEFRSVSFTNAAYSPCLIRQEGKYLLRITDQWGGTLFATRTNLSKEYQNIYWPAIGGQTKLEILDENCNVFIEEDITNLPTWGFE